MVDDKAKNFVDAMKNGRPTTVRVLNIDGDVYNGVAMGVESGKIRVAWYDGSTWHGDIFAPMFVTPAPELED